MLIWKNAGTLDDACALQDDCRNACLQLRRCAYWLQCGSKRNGATDIHAQTRYASAKDVVPTMYMAFALKLRDTRE